VRRPTVLFVGTRRTAHEVNAAAFGARRAGYDIALLAPAPPRCSPDLVADHEIVDLFDRPRALQAGIELGRRARVRGVVTWMDTGVELAAAIAEQLDLPGPTRAAARRARDKHAMRTALADAGRHDLIPAFRSVATLGDLEVAAAAIRGPAVLKPAGGNGSKGILQIEDDTDLRAAWATALAVAAPANDPVFGDFEGRFVYEQRLGGSEHSVEGLVHEGRTLIAGITDKWVTPDHYLEYQEIHPTALPPDAAARVIDLTQTVVRAIGIDSCAFHLECRVMSDGSAKLLEIAARPAGGHITSHLIPLSTGIDFHADLVRVATGSPPELRRAGDPLFAGRRNVVSPVAGRFDGVENLDRILRIWGVEHVFFEQPLGARIVLPPEQSLASNLMSVIARAGSSREVHELLARAIGLATPRVVEALR
jgi:biotin carboxylase